MAIFVQTPHNVAIAYTQSSIWRRIMAFWIDFIFISILFLALWAISSTYRLGFTDSELYTFFVFLIYSLYHLLFEYFNNGRSIGKMLLGMRVMKADGTHPTFGDYFIRWIFRTLDITATAGLLAYFMIGFSKKSQRLGDLIANTTVIDLKINKIIHLTKESLTFKDDYVVSFPMVADKLSDKDIRIIISILKEGDENTQLKLYYKLTEVLDIQQKQDEVRKYQSVNQFLRKVIDDYNYLATNKA